MQKYTCSAETAAALMQWCLCKVLIHVIAVMLRSLLLDLNLKTCVDKIV